MAVPQRKEIKLPDVTAAIEGHLWDHLLDPHPADAGKDVRDWVLGSKSAVFILNDNLMEVVEERASSPSFHKWKFASPNAAYDFGVMMLPYCTVFGLM